MNTLQTIRDIRHNHHIHNARIVRHELRRSFSIAVRDGKMYIMCGSRAVSQIDDRQTVGSAIAAMDSMCRSAFSYEKVDSLEQEAKPDSESERTLTLLLFGISLVAFAVCAVILVMR